MQTTRSYFPDLETLTAALTAALRAAGDAGGPLTILDRQPNPHESTFPSEVVTCRLGEGRELRLFCKYGVDRDNRANGHRGGVPYEAEVYHHILGPLGLPAPRFYGVQAAGMVAGAWLILENLDGAVRLRDTKEAVAWDQAARRAGHFHAAHDTPPDPALRFLSAYDTAYYVGWARRTAECAGPLHQDFPWLATVCRNFEEALAPLLKAPRTVIHGEYYPKNLLFCGGTVYAVDWESAAIGPGEIDLAMLTDRCPEDLTRRCERIYQEARWPEGTPSDFGRTMDLARLYIHLRWLGDGRGRTTGRKKFWRYEAVRVLGECLGLLEGWSARSESAPQGRQ